MAEIIYCKLTETRSRRTWQILPKQYFPDKTPVYELAVSISQYTIDRVQHPFDCIVGLYAKQLNFASTQKYYFYSGDVYSIADDPKADSGYQKYLKNRDKTPEEIEEEEAKLKSKVLYQIKSNPDIVPMSIDKDGFYIKDETFYLLTRNIYKRVNTMLTGPTGSGKTQVVELICKQLGIPCTIYDMGAMHDPISDLLGVHRLDDGKSIFDYAKFTQDVQKPGVIVLDELSRCPATALNILFPVLDHRRTLPVEIAGSKDIREIPIHPEVCFISTCNIGIEYTGTSTLDKALKNRFFPIEFTYLPADIEARVLMKRCDIEKQDADMITSIAAKLRRMAENAEAATTVSTRETLMIAELIHDGWSTLDALNYVLIPLCDSKESRELVRKLLMSK